MDTNRILDAIHKNGEAIKAKGHSKEKLAELSKAMDLEFDEFVAFQNLKNLEWMNGILTLDEANTLYRYLGETPAHFNKQSLAVKFTLVQTFGKLLQLSIRRRTA